MVLRYFIGLMVILLLYPWLAEVNYTMRVFLHCSVFALGIPISEFLIKSKDST
jgi:hypothetical protein